MPLRRRVPGNRFARRQRARRNYMRGRNIRRKAMYQSQVFTETFKANSQAIPPTNPGIGADGVIQVAAGTQFTPGKFMVKFTDIPQFQNYSNL